MGTYHLSFIMQHIVKIEYYIPHFSLHQANNQDISHLAGTFSGNSVIYQQVPAASDQG